MLNSKTIYPSISPFDQMQLKLLDWPQILAATSSVKKIKHSWHISY